MDKIFSKEEINNERQIELDIAKALCIFLMVLTHALASLPIITTIETGSASYILKTVICNFTGASVFMICMGIGFNYTKHNDDYKFFIKRGISILIIAYLLNFVRNLFFIFGTAKILNKFNYNSIVSELLEIDILQFAGLSMITLGIFKKLNIKPVYIFLFSIICSLFVTLTPLFAINDAIINGIIGLITPYISVEFKEYDTCFPFLNWFIVPAFGYYFSYYLKRVKDKKVFWGFFVCLAVIIFSIYSLFTMQKKLGLFSPDDFVYYHINILNACVNIFCSLGLIGILYFISLILPENIKKINTILSTNINQIFCIHWVLISWINDIYIIIYFVLHKSTDYIRWPENLCLLIGIIVFITSAIIAFYYSKFKYAIKEKLNIK